MINDEFGQRLRMAFNAPRELPVHRLFNEWWSHVPTDVANSYVALLAADEIFRAFIDDGRYGAPLDLDVLAGQAVGSLGHSYRE